MNKNPIVLLIAICFFTLACTSSKAAATEPNVAESEPMNITAVSDTNAENNAPYYFIAIHLEPWNVARIANNYPVLENMIANANQYDIKLTLMFSAQWADYIYENDKISDVVAWQNQGHEIAIHHHSIYHQSWDGYSDYTAAEAIAKRVELGHIPPEAYLGTLDDFTAKAHFLNADVTSGCANEETDKMALPDEIIYATCSGFQNFGTPGTEMNDLIPAKGRSEFITTGFVNGIQRKWLTHFQLFIDGDGAKQAFSTTDANNVYGVVMHSENTDAVSLADYLEFLHLEDPTAEKSSTVAEIIESGLLPEEQITTSTETVYLPIISTPQSIDSVTLLKTIDISPKLSPDGAPVGRPDVVGIGDTLHLAYGIQTERNFHLVKMNADLELTLIEDNPMELFSGYHDFSVDIRVSQANNNLWYAFEDNKWNAAIDDTHFLNAAWYSGTHTLVGEQTDIATGILTTIPEAFSVDPNDVPPDPEAVDDPTPFYHNGSYYIFTRAWSGWIDEFTPNSKHHIRIFNESFEQTDDFMLDLSAIIPGKTLSQNTLVDIDGQVFLIGGFYNARDDIAGGSSIYAIPLSDDLKSTTGEKIPLLVETGKWYFKVTAARMYNGNLFINYQEMLSGETTHNIAVFDVSNNYELIENVEISRILMGEGVVANHTTFEIVNDKLYVFYPEVGNKIFTKIFRL